MEETDRSAPRQKPIKVLVVDPALEFRLMVRAILSRFSSLQVVAAVRDGDNITEELLKHRPDVILMSLELPGQDGLAVLKQLMTRHPIPTIMLYSDLAHGSEIRYEAYRYGAIAVMDRPQAPLRDESDWGERLLKTVQGTVGIRVEKVGEEHRPGKGKEESAVWEKQIFFCEECGAQNILERAKLSDKVPPRCQNCGDVIPLQTLERYRKFTVCLAMIVARDGIGTLLRLIPGLPENLSAAFIFLLDDDDVGEIVSFLKVRSAIRVHRLHHRITVEGGACYLGSTREIVRFSSATSHPTLEVESHEAQGDENPYEILFSSMARHVKDKSVGTVLGNCDEQMTVAMRTITLHGGQTIILDPDSFYNEDTFQDLNSTLNISTDMVDKVLDIIGYLSGTGA